MKISKLTFTAFLILSFLSSCFHSHKEKANLQEFNNSLKWETLQDITYQDIYLDELDAWFWQPSYSEELCALDDTEVNISGFLQDQSSDEEPYYLLCSHKHMHMDCCGSTKPHEIVELSSDFDSKSFTTGDSISITGTLALNHGDVYTMNYKIENATISD